MKVPMAGYNERSWAIDLIGHLKSIAARQNRSVRDAGGEQLSPPDTACQE